MNDVLDRYVALKRDLHIRKKRPKELTKSVEFSLKPIRAHFGALHPSEITPDYVRAYAANRRATARRRGETRKGQAPSSIAISGTVSDRTISIELANLRAALNRAAKDRAIPAETVPFIELPEGTARPRRRALKRTEFARFMRALYHPDTSQHIKAFVLLGVLTSQRSKAIKALKWEHVDFEEGVIRFTETDPHAAANKRIQDTPLTPAMTKELIALQDFAHSEWGKQHGTMRKTKHRGLKRVGQDFTLNIIAYNLVRLIKLAPA